MDVPVSLSFARKCFTSHEVWSASPKSIMSQLYTGVYTAQMLPIFRQTMALVLPFLGGVGIRRVHLRGVLHAPALADLLWLCSQYQVMLSTDSVGPQVRPALGRWGYADWCDWTYQSAPSLPPEREPQAAVGPVNTADGQQIMLPHVKGRHRAEHVRQVRAWLAGFRRSAFYPATEPGWWRQPRQLALATLL